MLDYSPTSAWKSFVLAPQTLKLIDKIAKRISALLLSGENLTYQGFNDLAEEMPPALWKSFCIPLEGRGWNYKDEIIELQQAQWLVGAALGNVFAQASISPLRILKLVEASHGWQGFNTVIRQVAHNSQEARCIAKLLGQAIDDLESEPGNYCMFRSERENFAINLMEWRKNPRLEDIYNVGRDWGHFPVRLPAIGVLGELLPTYGGLVVNLLTKITPPPVLHEALWSIGSECGDHAGESFVSLFAETPEIISEEGVWNGSLLAPAILQWGLNYSWWEFERERQVEAGAEDAIAEKLRAMWHNFAEILSARKDSFMLSTSFLARYLPQISANSHRNDIMGKALEIASFALKNIASNITSNPEKIFFEAFGIPFMEARNDYELFVQTGILNAPREHMKLGNYLSVIPMGEMPNAEEAETALNFFNYLICYAKNGLVTTHYGELPTSSHYCIGNLYAASCDAVGSWRNTWRNLSAMRYKLRNSPYGSESVNERGILNFVLVCGICACDALTGKCEQVKTRLKKTVVEAQADYMAWDIMQDDFFKRISNL